jgi:hypothetical protein
VAPGRELAAEMARRSKPHDVHIYPAVGKTAEEGHNFLFERVDLWEKDAFAFLSEHTRP